MAKNDTFGWDLLYKVTQPQINSNYDVVICLTHWALIRHGFRCVGVGEDTTQPTQEELSELLPEGWNTGNKYTLRYVHNGKLYLFNAVKNDTNIIINLNRVVDNQASGTCVNVHAVKELHGSLSRIIPDYEELITKIRKELIDPMLQSVYSKEVETQTSQEASGSLRAEPRRSDSYFMPQPRDIPNPGFPFNDPMSVGRSDLDPFAPAGGGMLFQPPGIGRTPGSNIDPSLPRGSVPPGARFDPYRPLGPGPPRAPHRNPDHDHLPPPGYDDMFM